MPGGFMFTASSQMGWRDIAVVGTDDMREAIQLAERASGCRVSHGRGHIGADFNPALTVDARTGEVVEHHQRAAKPDVWMGPPDVVRAIMQVLNPPKRSG
jgi:hypothetical protein